MKKAITLALVFVLALSLLTACGSNDNGGTGSTTTPPANNSTTNPPSSTPPASQGGNNNETAIKDVSTSNWQAVVKDYFGVEISVPDGWSLTSATSLNEMSDVTITFTPGTATSWDSFGSTLFDKTKAVSTKQMEKATSATAVNAFADAIDWGENSSWKYFYGANDARVQVMYSVEGDTVELSFDGLTK
jgi:hypothetical protein